MDFGKICSLERFEFPDLHRKSSNENFASMASSPGSSTTSGSTAGTYLEFKVTTRVHFSCLKEILKGKLTSPATLRGVSEDRSNALQRGSHRADAAAA